MKRILFIILIAASAVINCKAQTVGNSLQITDTKIDAGSYKLTLSFTAVVPKSAMKNNEVMVFVPVISDGNYKVSFTPVIVEGRRSRINRTRHELSAGSAYYDSPFVSMRGETVRYTSTVAVQPWMDSSNLVMEVELSGCCSAPKSDIILIANNVRVPIEREAPTIEIVEVIEEPVFVPVSKADTLSISYSFIQPESDYDPAAPFKVYDQDREKSLIIYFRQGSSKIEYTYADNAETIRSLIESVNLIQASDNSRVKYVVVAGFASPEGGFEVNDRLAFERAVSVKDYIARTTDMAEDKIKVFNGSVDWRGLRFMVENSYMPDKKQVLDIIDNTPIWDSKRQTGRLGELMRLNGGSTYRYMYREFFPKLRNGAFIKVFYENN